MKMRKTKLVCTIGPAVDNPDLLEHLLRAGMNVARFNFSHGDHETHRRMIRMVRAASVATGIPVALLLDTKGPEIRTGEVANGTPVHLKAGGRICLTTDDVPGTSELLSISYKQLPGEVKPGVHVLIADGLIDLEVLSITGNLIQCAIHSDGFIGGKKNVNVIGVRTQLPSVSEKDRQDLKLAMEEQLDFVAASFVRKASDVREIQNELELHCATGEMLPQIIAKIEDEEGLSNIDDIIRVSCGVMVARGDLGVQLPPEEIPLVQKRIIKKCNAAGKLVIVATQMLDSMIRNPLPTRAEVADVANAVVDGADAIMLSGETASGKYPVEAAAMMHRIAFETEQSEYGQIPASLGQIEYGSMSDSIARAAVLTAANIGADAIVAPTFRGNTPRLLSQFRPVQPIVAVTPFESVRRRLMLHWGVYPLLSEEVKDADTMIEHAIARATEHGMVKAFDRIVLAVGVPLESPIMLNTMRVEVLADVAGHGLRGYGNSVDGTVVKVHSALEALERVENMADAILVVRYLDESYIPVMNKIAGYVVEHFSSVAWARFQGQNLNLVAIAGAPQVFDTLVDGEQVRLDGQNRLVLRSPVA